MVRLLTALVATGLTAMLWAAPASANLKHCEVFSRQQAWQVREHLLTFSNDVLGKPAIEWGPKDFEWITGLAQQCHGYVSAGGGTVRADLWRVQLKRAREKVVPVSSAAAVAHAVIRQIKTDKIRLPACDRLLLWHRNPLEFTDSSEEIFGRHLLQMNQQDLQAITTFVSACMNYLPDLAKGRHGRQYDATERQMQSLTDAAQEIAAIQKMSTPSRPTDISVRLNGLEIPLGLASERTRRLVGKFNAAAANGKLPTTLISDIAREANAIIADAQAKVDLEFAKAVKSRLNKEIFGG